MVLEESLSKYDSAVPESARRLADEIDLIKAEYESINNKILVTWPIILFGFASALGAGATDVIAIGVGGGVVLTIGGIVWQIDLRRALSRNLSRSVKAEFAMEDLGWSYFDRDKKFSRRNQS